jgi:hypothetical protein
MGEHAHNGARLSTGVTGGNADYGGRGVEPRRRFQGLRGWQLAVFVVLVAVAGLLLARASYEDTQVQEAVSSIFALDTNVIFLVYSPISELYVADTSALMKFPCTGHVTVRGECVVKLASGTQISFAPGGASVKDKVFRCQPTSQTLIVKLLPTGETRTVENYDGY